MPCSCTLPQEEGSLCKRERAGEWAPKEEDSSTFAGVGPTTDNPSGLSTADLISRVCDGIKELLLKKNRAYGDSALKPLRIFSRATAAEGINVRIDDKLSRIARGEDTEEVPEDTVDDLIGYLVMKKVEQLARGGAK
jgi:hypothetical protein